jgi:hypothetical protein
MYIMARGSCDLMSRLLEDWLDLLSTVFASGVRRPPPNSMQAWTCRAFQMWSAAFPTRRSFCRRARQKLPFRFIVDLSGELNLRPVDLRLERFLEIVPFAPRYLCGDTKR